MLAGAREQVRPERTPDAENPTSRAYNRRETGIFLCRVESAARADASGAADSGVARRVPISSAVDETPREKTRKEQRARAAQRPRYG